MGVWWVGSIHQWLVGGWEWGRGWTVRGECGVGVCTWKWHGGCAWTSVSSSRGGSGSPEPDSSACLDKGVPTPCEFVRVLVWSAPQFRRIMVKVNYFVFVTAAVSAVCAAAAAVHFRSACCWACCTPPPGATTHSHCSSWQQMSACCPEVSGLELVPQGIIVNSKYLLAVSDTAALCYRESLRRLHQSGLKPTCDCKAAFV